MTTLHMSKKVTTITILARSLVFSMSMSRNVFLKCGHASRQNISIDEGCIPFREGFILGVITQVRLTSII